LTVLDGAVEPAVEVVERLPDVTELTGVRQGVAERLVRAGERLGVLRLPARPLLVAEGERADRDGAHDGQRRACALRDAADPAGRARGAAGRTGAAPTALTAPAVAASVFATRSSPISRLTPVIAPASWSAFAIPPSAMTAESAVPIAGIRSISLFSPVRMSPSSFVNSTSGPLDPAIRENSSSACVTAFRKTGPNAAVVELTTFSSAGSSCVRIVWISGATCSPLPSRPNVFAMSTSSLPTSYAAGRARSKNSLIAFAPFALSVHSRNLSALSVTDFSRSLPSGYAALARLNSAAPTSPAIRASRSSVIRVLSKKSASVPDLRPASACLSIRSENLTALRVIQSTSGPAASVMCRSASARFSATSPPRLSVTVLRSPCVCEVPAPRLRADHVAGLAREVAEHDGGVADDLLQDRQVPRRALDPVLEPGEQALLRLLGEVADRGLELVEFLRERFCACGSSSLNFFELVSSRSFSPPTAWKTFAVASLNTPSPCAAAEPSAG
jgi:hypothetical protein